MCSYNKATVKLRYSRQIKRPSEAWDSSLYDYRARILKRGNSLTEKTVISYNM